VKMSLSAEKLNSIAWQKIGTANAFARGFLIFEISKRNQQGGHI